MEYEINLGDWPVGILNVGKPHWSLAIIQSWARVTSGASDVGQAKCIRAVLCIQDYRFIWCLTEDIGSTRIRGRFRSWNGQDIVMERMNLIVIPLRRLVRPQ